MFAGGFAHTFLRNTCCAFQNAEALALALAPESRAEASFIERHRHDFSRIVDGLTMGPSPAQLVLAGDADPETSPLTYFECLPAESAREIAAAVQAAFERDFRPDIRRAALVPLGAALFARLDAFMSDVTQERMTEVQDAARALYAEMSTLPRGIWFWDDEHTHNS